MASEQGHWVTLDDGRKIFIKEDLIDKQYREIAKQEEQARELNGVYKNYIPSSFSNIYRPGTLKEGLWVVEQGTSEPEPRQVKSVKYIPTPGGNGYYQVAFTDGESVNYDKDDKFTRVDEPILQEFVITYYEDGQKYIGETILATSERDAERRYRQLHPSVYNVSARL